MFNFVAVMGKGNSAVFFFSSFFKDVHKCFLQIVEISSKLFVWNWPVPTKDSASKGIIILWLRNFGLIMINIVGISMHQLKSESLVQANRFSSYVTEYDS